MFVKFIEHFSKNPNLRIPHIGTVVVNNDPDQLGGLKVFIPGLLEFGEADLPWIERRRSSALGASSNSSSFIVPEVGSQVLVIFPFEDINFGIYDSIVENSNTINALFKEDYPNSYGFLDSIGNYFKVNKTKEFIEGVHSSGTKFKVTQEGNLEITVVGNLTINTSGNVISTSDGPTTIIGSTVNLNP